MLDLSHQRKGLALLLFALLPGCTARPSHEQARVSDSVHAIETLPKVVAATPLKAQPTLLARHALHVQSNAGPRFVLTREKGDRITADQLAPGLVAYFDDRAGISVSRTGEAEGLKMAVTGMGCAKQLHDLSSQGTSIIANKISYNHQAGNQKVEEWFINGPLGVEHGLTIESADDCANEGHKLVVRIAAEGLTPRLNQARNVIELYDSQNKKQLEYAGLSVVDAAGKSLPAGFNIVNDTIYLVIQTNNAVLPISVDPLIMVPKQRIAGDAKYDSFGETVAIDGNIAAIAAPNDSDGGIFTGAVYIYERVNNTWTYSAKIRMAQPRAAGFGGSLAVSGDTVVAGEPWGSSGPGRVMVARKVGAAWTEEFLFEGAQDGDGCGTAVAIKGDDLIVGCPWSDNPPSGMYPINPVGIVHIFHRTGTSWAEQATLSPSDPQAAAWFGSAVAIEGDLAVLGVSGYTDGNFNYAGRVEYAKRTGSTWAQSAPIQSPIEFAGENFGEALALENNTLLVGAPGKNPSSGQDGTVYVYQYDSALNEFTQEAALIHPEPTSFIERNFGSYVQLKGDRAVIGTVPQNGEPNPQRQAITFERNGTWDTGTPFSWGREDGSYAASPIGLGVDLMILTDLDDATLGQSAGSAISYTFSGGAWVPEITLYPDGASINDLFGTSIAMNAAGDVAIIGAPNAVDYNFYSGRAAVYRRGPNGWVMEASFGANNASDGEGFGTSVAINAAGDKIVIGSPRNSETIPSAGNAFVYAFNPFADPPTWQYETTLQDPGAQAGEDYGAAVAITESMGATIVAVGAPLFTPEAAYDGKVVLFSHSASTYDFINVLGPPLGLGDRHFGEALAFEADTLVIGAPGAQSVNGDANSGSIYVTQHDLMGFSIPQALENPTPGAELYYGTSVAISNGVIAVGSLGNGRVDLWEQTAGVYSNTSAITPSVASPTFGTTVRLHNGKALIGEDQKISLFVDSGAGYTFQSELPVAQTIPSFDVNDSYALIGLYNDSSGADVAGLVFEYALMPGNGDSCTLDTDCGSGYCSEGVCCDQACGAGNPNDCQSCLAINTGVVDGVCAPIQAVSQTVCATALDDCHNDAVCDGLSTGCPAFTEKPDGTTCVGGMCVTGTCMGTGGSGGTAGTGGSGGTGGTGGSGATGGSAGTSGTAGTAGHSHVDPPDLWGVFQGGGNAGSAGANQAGSAGTSNQTGGAAAGVNIEDLPEADKVNDFQKENPQCSQQPVPNQNSLWGLLMPFAAMVWSARKRRP